MRQRFYWNDGWYFTPDFSEALVKSSFKADKLEAVRLPHSTVETPFHYFDESIYQMTAGYRREFEADESWRGKRLLLCFEGAAHRAAVYINGTEAAVHENGYTAFSVDITPYVNYNGTNILAVRLESSEELNQPPFGFVIDYMTYGGLYREVYLDIINPVHLADVYVTTGDIGKIEKTVHSELALSMPEGSVPLGDYSVSQTLERADGSLVKQFDSKPLTDLELKTRENGNALPEEPGDLRLIVGQKVSDVELWGLQTPVLYSLKTELLHDGQPVDQYTVRFGFRSAEFKTDGFYLNGEKLKIRGLNRHQSYPYVGYAMPRSVQEDDADILKNTLNLNAVRTSHYTQSQHFINRCDEIGLLVFTEIPGWQHIGDAEWKEKTCRNTAEMVLQYRNHPSIILWGVRINESLDDDGLYLETNRIAHALDGSRQTSGVRYLEKSSLLEDVYSYNDFSHTGDNPGVLPKKKVTPDSAKPYLVSEYNGHMFPTKPFDAERLRTGHALRHANVLAGYYSHEDIAGGFGWCMTDYNTHRDFGSGDRVCYHGVLDMFRNPKTSAFVYASQSDAGSDGEIVADVSSSMEIGEHPAGYIGPVYVFTNADSVKLYKNDVFIREFFPDKGQYASMPHPPVVIDDFIGELLESKEGYGRRKSEALKDVMRAVQRYGQAALPMRYKLKMLYLMLRYRLSFSDGVRLFSEYVANWGGQAVIYRFDLLKGGNVAKSIERGPMTEARLSVMPAKTDLTDGPGWDAACVRFRMEDERGTLLPYSSEVVKLSVSGNISIIGPDVVPLRGGFGGTYVKTEPATSAEDAETASLTVSCAGSEQVIGFNIKRRQE